MATHLGSHAERLTRLRALHTVKGRREQRRYAFEGATLLSEAYAAGTIVEEIYATETAYEKTPLLSELDRAGVPCFLIADRAARSISDVETPTGIVGVTPARTVAPTELLKLPGPMPLLADLNDPANAGGLLRSADAFGCRGALFGGLGVDPYHPKVVRASMGAIFRLAVAVAEPDAAAGALLSAGRRLIGLSPAGEEIGDGEWDPGSVLAVGHERHGLGRWQAHCERLVAIPMKGRTESLSAAVAGSIGLYLASRRMLPEKPS